MEKKHVQPPQSSLILRILGGGYLVCLAYDLLFKSSSPLSTFLIIAAVVFALVGGTLLFVSCYQLLTHEYFYQKNESSDAEGPEDEEAEDL